MFVLVLQVVFDLEWLFFQRLDPMEVAGTLMSIGGKFCNSEPVDTPHNIPIGLRTICHKAFELRLGESMARHDVVEVMSEKHLSIIFVDLEVATSDGHDAQVGSIIYVASEVGPRGDAFDMIGHDPSMVEILVRLYALNHVDPTTRESTLYILKTKTLSVLSPWLGN